MRTLIPILIGLLVVGCGKEEKNDAMPSELVAEWADAWFQFGWMGPDRTAITRSNPHYRFSSYPDEFYPNRGVPSFELVLPNWHRNRTRQFPKVLQTLPVPTTAFGVFLNSNTEATDEDLKEIARFKQITVLSVAWAPITDAGLKEVAQLQQLFCLCLFGSKQITDAGLEEVAKLHKLTILDLSYCKQITDIGLKELSHLKQLTILYLRACERITDVSLKELAKLQKLELLALSGTKTTDVGLEEVAKLKNLKTLLLRWTKITDAGLEKVAKLQNLTVLDLRGCERITDVGVAELQKALPKCKITHNAK